VDVPFLNSRNFELELLNVLVISFAKNAPFQLEYGLPSSLDFFSVISDLGLNN
jgi:hypothetical protein